MTDSIRPLAPAAAQVLRPAAAPTASDGLRRAVASIIRDELTFQRGEDPGLVPAEWTDQTPLAGPEIRADSLEVIGLAARVNQAFHLHEWGGDADLRRTPLLGQWTDLVRRSLLRPDARVTFLTSGSTGEPKACLHTVADLDRETAFLAERFADRRRIVATVPAHHIYGFLFTVRLPAALGVPVLEAVGRTGSEVRRELAPGDLLVGFPLGWEDLASGPGVPPPPDVWGVTSTAPCPASVLERAREAGFGPITEVYGSSETGGIGTREDPAEAYELMPHVDRETAAATFDRLEWTGPRRFRVLGRRDPVVQVGGVNVFPDRVAEALRDHPAVDDAAVRLMRADEGRRLKAFVVLAPETDPAGLARELDAWLADRFEAPARPRAIRFGPALPRTASGKAADWDAFGESRDAAA